MMGALAGSPAGRARPGRPHHGRGDPPMWGFQPADVLAVAVAIGTLVVLEGLLSADNALVLAVMVRLLPEKLQKRALRYGIWGAFLFRFIAVIFATLLLGYWQLKVVGGLYLLYLAASHF